MTKSELALTAFMQHFAPLLHVDTPHPEVVRLFEMGRKALAEAERKG